MKNLPETVKFLIIKSKKSVTSVTHLQPVSGSLSSTLADVTDKQMFWQTFQVVMGYSRESRVEGRGSKTVGAWERGSVGARLDSPIEQESEGAREGGSVGARLDSPIEQESPANDPILALSLPRSLAPSEKFLRSLAPSEKFLRPFAP